MSIQKLLLLGAFLLLAATSLRGEEKKAKLTVNIVNTEENTGKLYVYLFNVADDYPMETEKARMTKVVRVKNNRGRVIRNVDYEHVAVVTLKPGHFTAYRKLQRDTYTHVNDANIGSPVDFNTMNRTLSDTNVRSRQYSSFIPIYQRI